MNKHTPGPWQIVNPGLADIYCTVHGANGGGVCAIGAGSRENHHFNARLIAAAPDLLAALEHLLGAADPTTERADDEYFDYADLYIACDAARAAIAKARGA